MWCHYGLSLTCCHMACAHGTNPIAAFLSFISFHVFTNTSLGHHDDSSIGMDAYQSLYKGVMQQVQHIVSRCMLPTVAIHVVIVDIKNVTTHAHCQHMHVTLSACGTSSSLWALCEGTCTFCPAPCSFLTPTRLRRDRWSSRMLDCMPSWLHCIEMPFFLSVCHLLLSQL